MSAAWIVAGIIAFFAWVWRQAIKWHRIEMEKQKRELVFKVEVERTEREIKEKSLADVINDSNKRYDDRESK